VPVSSAPGLLPFLLEIGTEELPPSVQQPAAEELARRVAALFSEHELTTGATEVFYTPRRLAVRFADVPAEKPAREVELQGPPKKAAFDSAGSPTRTAQGFAAAHGKTPADIFLKATPKGEYAFIRKQAPAVPTADILGAGLGPLVASLPFPRNMRWQEGKLRFSRPIRWLVCLLGTDIIPFSLDSLTAGNTTLGHRNFSPCPAAIPAPADYERVLRECRVIASPADRRAAIASALAAAAAARDCVPLQDDELIEETISITEWPEAILCSFDSSYLGLPHEVLVTALKKHQRCFAVVTKQGGPLAPCFIAVANTPGCDHAQVRLWYEKAVDSRLRDARFFYEADLKLGLEPLVEEEKKVVWREGMGTLYDKTQRLRKLCAHLAAVVPGTDAATLDRAAQLCKADLLTQMVREKEFTSLQGIMGGIYAGELGEAAAVKLAIYEHYLPSFIGDRMPSRRHAALLSIADKTDNIVAAFVTGAVPTGSEDPLALRRQAAGLLTIILELKLPIDAQELTRKAAGLFPAAPAELPARLDDFFRERMATLLAEGVTTDQGTTIYVTYDVANAVLATHWHTPAEALARAQALTEFRDRPEFEKLVVGQKRVANILKGINIEGLPDPKLLTETAEQNLWEQSQQVEPELDAALARANYARAFELLLGLRGAIDQLFTDVMVMAEDAKLRDNRLRLLGYVRSLFRKVADLSLIVLEGETS